MASDGAAARDLWAADVAGAAEALAQLREANARLPAAHPVSRSLDRISLETAEAELGKILARAGRAKVVTVKMVPENDGEADDGDAA